jgi:glycosyltransferase involved in cell wall biosynthesis
MQLRVRRGKGAKERVLPLSQRLLQELEGYWRAQRKGLRVAQRLDGMNWVHKRTHTGLRHYLRSEVNNWILATIRRRLADHIVYQSQFSRNLWETVWGPISASAEVVYNAVDLAAYQPQGPGEPPTDHIRILVVEGHLDNGHELEAEHAMRLRSELESRLHTPVELMVAGDVPESIRKSMEARFPGWVTWKGVVKRSEIPELDRSSHLLFPVEINAACPNSVIEAMACGLPVISFSTGSLSELVDDDAGRVVPYGGNYWKLEPGDIPALADAALEVLNDLPAYRQRARQRAERLFGVDEMVEKYLKVLMG